MPHGLDSACHVAKLMPRNFVTAECFVIMVRQPHPGSVVVELSRPLSRQIEVVPPRARKPLAERLGVFAAAGEHPSRLPGVCPTAIHTLHEYDDDIQQTSDSDEDERIPVAYRQDRRARRRRG